ncbi:deoxyguanosinetriphosphate triphosphohydrolase family protein [Thermosulfuriphilus sp.]
MALDFQKIKDEVQMAFEGRLSPLATPHSAAKRERYEDQLDSDYRLPFSIDADRILHSLAYTRYIDKTQVFSLMENVHITRRVIHVQLVSKIARTIGRYLGLNEDLIEAIALGHDIGHPPFGHEGERFLDALAKEHGLSSFQHNIQGVRALRRLERKGFGWNLTLQVYDGILCHDGESNDYCLAPDRTKNDFSHLDEEIRRRAEDPSYPLRPMTMEGCVVRLADTISYIGRDIEDAILVGLIQREDIPKDCQEVLGRTNGQIVFRLVTNLIAQSRGKEELTFSPEVAETLKKLKAFNLERIYLNPAIKRDMDKIGWLFEHIFNRCLEDLQRHRKRSPIFRDFLNQMDEQYLEETPAPQVVIDFIAGMTDEYFVSLSREFFFPGRLKALL